MNLSVGSRYEITTKSKKTVETFTAIISWVEDREGYKYFGYTPDDIMQGKFGCARLYETAQAFGVQSIRKVNSKAKTIIEHIA